jgi:hypothetical protein
VFDLPGSLRLYGIATALACPIIRLKIRSSYAQTKLRGSAETEVPIPTQVQSGSTRRSRAMLEMSENSAYISGNRIERAIPETGYEFDSWLWIN